MTDSGAATSEATMPADLQEALSIRYVDALRLVLLSSGRWAVFPLASGRDPRIMETLDPEVLKEMFQAQRQVEEAFKDSLRLRPSAAPSTRKPKVEISLEDLFS